MFQPTVEENKFVERVALPVRRVDRLRCRSNRRVRYGSAGEKEQLILSALVPM